MAPGRRCIDVTTNSVKPRLLRTLGKSRTGFKGRPSAIDLQVSLRPAKDLIDSESFFDGVDEMRAYLDRHLQDPERRRARLAVIAQELLKPRSPQELARWLVHQVAGALGATSVTLLVQTHEDAWRALEGQRYPPDDKLAHLSTTAQPAISVEGALLPLVGVEGVVGALWIELASPLDATAQSLMMAIADTVGVAVEQGMLVDAAF